MDRFCQNPDCKLIHKWQYGGQVRKSGEPRRNVLGDNVNSETLAESVVAQLSKAQRLLVSVPAIESKTSG